MFGFLRKTKNNNIEYTIKEIDQKVSIANTIENTINTTVDRVISTLDADIKSTFMLEADIREKKGKIEELNANISELSLQKKMDEREIAQLIKIAQEDAKLAAKEESLKLQKEYTEKEMKLREDFSKKELDNINNLRKEMKDIYSEIMKRLPNVNASLKVTSKS